MRACCECPEREAYVHYCIATRPKFAREGGIVRVKAVATRGGRPSRVSVICHYTIDAVDRLRIDGRGGQSCSSRGRSSGQRNHAGNAPGYQFEHNPPGGDAHYRGRARQRCFARQHGGADDGLVLAVERVLAADDQDGARRGHILRAGSGGAQRISITRRTQRSEAVRGRPSR